MKNIKSVFICVTALLLVTIFFGTQFYLAQFQLKNIRFERQETELLFASEDEVKMRALFAQRFTYLDRGKQSYVFLSEDGKYVLKFFDAHVLQPNPFFASETAAESARRKEERLFTGYRLAFLKERARTGLVFMRLAADPKVSAQVTVQDRFGIIHQIPLGTLPFVVQVRAVPTRKLITALLQKGDVEQVKWRLRQIVDLYLEGYQQGLCDEDHNFMYNTGFVEDHPIRIDPGRLREDEAFRQPEVYLRDLKKVAIDRMSGWMQRHFPSYRDEILADMEAKLEKVARSNVSE